ncbi:hypothetical protein SASPL_134887 [Salvia splendens]|uniref:Uncharacterized protein n=1 Tax=Salvia splendens TaxID=180675 RepID=A0A8X8WX59_SALSN|nr:hypothetical protein SASPL_134887 [Salvia splendens]
MAYNLQSLVTILQQILHPEQTHWAFDHNKPQLQSLLHKALMQILENSPHTKAASLESRIRDVVYKTEDIIESEMLHQMLSNPESQSLTFSTPDLQQVTQQLDSALVFLHDLTPDLLIDSGARCNEQGFPIGVSRLRNLQTLICQQPTTLGLPSEIWEMSELRHLKLYTTIEIGNGYNIRCACKKLQTIYFVRITPSLIRGGFFEIIPNIISLGIYYIDSPDIEVDLSHLHKLEKLRCESELNKDGSRFLHQLRFPCNIRKLILVGCVVFRSFLTTLCALPNLEVLVLSGCVFERDGEAEEEVWEVTEGDEFRSLQCLRLISLNIVHWRADETNFPILRELYVTGCNDLEEIPCDVGDIPTLQVIGISRCRASVVASAQQIQKAQQEEYENYDLKVVIEY